MLRPQHREQKEPFVDDNCKLLLHMNGVSGNAQFIDSSNVPKNVTAYGDAKLSNAHYRFGGTSAYFDGTGDYLLTPGSSDFAPQLTDTFTISVWYKRNTTDRMWLCGQSDSATTASTRQMEIQFQVDTTLIFSLQPTDQMITTTTFSDITSWHHLAIVGTLTTITLYHDGSQISQINRTTDGQISTYGFGIGHLGEQTGGFLWNGYIDEFIYWKGIAKPIGELYPQLRPYGYPIGGT